MNPSRYKLIALIAFILALVTLAACSSASTGPTASPSTAAPTTGAGVAPTTGGTGAATPPIGQAPTLAPSSAPTTNAEGVSIVFSPGRDGNQPGVVQLIPQGDKTQVVINMQPGPAGVAQPAQINTGSCPDVGPSKYPLTNVADGKSSTVVDVSLSDLLKIGYAVTVQKSSSEPIAYVACADLTPTSGTPTSGSVTVTLGPGRDGSQPGTAVLTPQGDKTQVVINVQPGPPGVPQPAHIHVGTCPGVGAVKYPLTNVVDGKSTTIVDDSLQDLLKGGYAINVHKSVSEIGIFVACGNVSSASSNAVPSTTPGLGPASGTATP